MTNQKLDVEIVLINDNNVVTHTFSNCTTDNFFNKGEQNTYAIERSIRLITDNKEVQVVIKDIQFHVSHLDSKLVIRIFH